MISNLQDLLCKAQQDQQQQGEMDDDYSETLDHPRSLPSPAAGPEDNLTLDDAENPLQLLARASDLQLLPVGLKPSPGVPQQTATVLNDGSCQGLESRESRESCDSVAKSFFMPFRAVRDVGVGIDPVDLGLVSGDETESLFALYVVLFSRCLYQSDLICLRDTAFIEIWRILDGVLIL